ncbi:hypothetical protein P9112_003398 [Eukaryota sp. TZLM1-RC]
MSSGISNSVYGVLFCELVRSIQSTVSRADDLMDKLESTGFPIGNKLIESIVYRQLKGKRPLNHNNALQAILKAWKHYFGQSLVLMHAMSAGERKPFECSLFTVYPLTLDIIKDTTPFVATFFSTPPDLKDSQGADLIRVTSFQAGIIKGMLGGLGFPCTIRTGHKPTEEHPQQTLFQVSFDQSVRNREL